MLSTEHWFPAWKTHIANDEISKVFYTNHQWVDWLLLRCRLPWAIIWRHQAKLFNEMSTKNVSCDCMDVGILSTATELSIKIKYIKRNCRKTREALDKSIFLHCTLFAATSQKMHQLYRLLLSAILLLVSSHFNFHKCNLLLYPQLYNKQT